MSERLPAGTVISANLASLIHLTSATTERSLATPYLKLMKVAAPQRGYRIPPPGAALCGEGLIASLRS